MSIEPYSIWASGGANLKYGPGYRSSQFLDKYYNKLESRFVNQVKIINDYFYLSGKMSTTHQEWLA